MKRHLIWLITGLGVLLALAGVGRLARPAAAPIQPVQLISPLSQRPTLSPRPSLRPRLRFVLQEVPFTAQAPLNQWGDGRFQDACEEATVLMAMKWVRGEALGTPAEVSREIIAMVNWQKERYGEYRDSSMTDTAKLLRDYFDYDDVEVKQNITLDDIKAVLQEGVVVITPMNGRAMGNPYFTPPGPERHMALIKGYDPAKKQFITNDAGTQHGKDYRYDETMFFNAIRDYSTGYHMPITKTEKTMLVVQKGTPP